MEQSDLICFSCIHRVSGQIGCKAFPDGIPDEIIETNEHDKPIDGQDNEMVFEPIKKGVVYKLASVPEHG